MSAGNGPMDLATAARKVQKSGELLVPPEMGKWLTKVVESQACQDFLLMLQNRRKSAPNPMAPDIFAIIVGINIGIEMERSAHETANADPQPPASASPEGQRKEE